MPRLSAVIWAQAVSWPCPCGLVPVTTSARPAVVIRTVAASQPPLCSRTPAATFEGERPPDSVKFPIPMPSSTVSPAARRRACSARRPVVVDELEGATHAGLVVPGVVLDARGHRARLGERRVEVAQPQLRRVHLQGAGEVVEDPLVGVRRLGAPGAAVGVGGREVGEDALAREVVGPEVVEPAVGERAEDGDARGQQLQVGAHVRDEADPHAEDLPLARGADRHVLDLPTPVRGRDVVLRAGLGPLHRPLEPPRQDQRQGLLGVDVELRAEAAADVRGDDAQLGVGDAADRGEDVAHEVRHLRRGVEGEAAADGIGRDDDRAGLHRRGDHALLHVAALDDHVGLGERRVDVADGERPGVAVVRAELLVHERGTGRERGLQVDRGGQLVVVHDHQLGGVPRRRRVARDDDRHGVPDVVDLGVGQRPVVGHEDVLGDRPPGGDAGDEVVGEVRAGEDGDDARVLPRRGRVDGGDPGVRDGAAHQGEVHRAERGDVVGPGAAAGEQRRVLATREALADVRGALGGRGGVGHGRCSRRRAVVE